MSLPVLIFVILYNLNLLHLQLISYPDQNYYTYEFKIQSDNENSPFDSNFTIFDNVLINKNLPVLKNIFFSYDLNSYDLLLNTNSHISVVVNKYCNECKWAENKYQRVLKNNNDLFHSFSFGVVSGFMDSDFITLLNYNRSLEYHFLSVLESSFMNTQVKFSGMLGIGSKVYSKDQFLFNLLHISNLNTNQTVGIEYSPYNNFTLGKLHLGGFPESIKNNLTFCTQTEKESSWGCLMDYILIGDEYDFYLAKNVNQVILFDSLSYFDIIPYEFLEYFQNSYFSANNNCTVNPVNQNETLFRIECYDFVGLQKIKSLNIILNGWSYRLGSRTLFDTEDIINSSNTKNNTYYFRVLFSKSSSYWVIGNCFLKKFMLGYDYNKNKVLLYSYLENDRYNFSKYTSENMEDDSSVFIFILLFLGLFLFFTIMCMWVLFYLKNRKIIKNYETQFIRENFEG